MFNKAIRKLTQIFNKLEEDVISEKLALPKSVESGLSNKIEESLDDELENEAKVVYKELDQKQKQLLESLTDGKLEEYAISGSEKQWRDNLKAAGKNAPANVSIKTGKKRSLPNPTEEQPRKKPKWNNKSPGKKNSSKKPKRNHPR